MGTIKKSIVVDCPVRTCYDQWTQFEEFPKFMEGVEFVKQLDDKRLRWRANVWGKIEEWDAEIVEQTPDTIVSWRSTSGARNTGSVTFHPEGPDKTRIDLRLEIEPKGALESTGEALGVVDRRVAGDLDRFKSFIEGRRQPTGAWRGEIHGGKVEEREEEEAGR